jgi:hypothetical protein
MAGSFRNLAFLAFFLLPSVSWGQGVYVTEGPNGPTFSNIPQQGSKEINLRPLTVIEATKEPPAPPARGAAGRGNAGREERPRGASPGASSNAPGEAPYRAFSVTWPEDRGSVIINPGTFDVRLSVDPTLRLEEGHAFTVSINGDPVRERFTATEFMIPPEFWGESIPMNQLATLEAAIVDRNGIVIQQAPPVNFLMRFTTVLQNPNRDSHRHPYGTILPGHLNSSTDRHPPRGPGALPPGPGFDSSDRHPGGKPPPGKWGNEGKHADGGPPAKGGGKSPPGKTSSGKGNGKPPAGKSGGKAG